MVTYGGLWWYVVAYFHVYLVIYFSKAFCDCGYSWINHGPCLRMTIKMVSNIFLLKHHYNKSYCACANMYVDIPLQKYWALSTWALSFWDSLLKSFLEMVVSVFNFANILTIMGYYSRHFQMFGPVLWIKHCLIFILIFISSISEELDNNFIYHMLEFLPYLLSLFIHFDL